MITRRRAARPATAPARQTSSAARQTRFGDRSDSPDRRIRYETARGSATNVRCRAARSTGTPSAARGIRPARTPRTRSVEVDLPEGADAHERSAPFAPSGPDVVSSSKVIGVAARDLHAEHLCAERRVDLDLRQRQRNRSRRPSTLTSRIVRGRPSWKSRYSARQPGSRSAAATPRGAARHRDRLAMQIDFVEPSADDAPIIAERRPTQETPACIRSGRRTADPRHRAAPGHGLETGAGLSVLEHALVARQQQRGFAIRRGEDEERLTERCGRLEACGRGSGAGRPADAPQRLACDRSAARRFRRRGRSAGGRRPSPARALGGVGRRRAGPGR